jgi:hypothetical protein
VRPRRATGTYRTNQKKSARVGARDDDRYAKGARTKEACSSDTSLRSRHTPAGASANPIKPHFCQPTRSNHVFAAATHGGPMLRKVPGNALAKPSNEPADESGSSDALRACFL